MHSSKFIAYAVVGAVLLANRDAHAATAVVSVQRQADGSLQCESMPGGTNIAGGGAASVQFGNPPNGVALKTYEVTGGATPKAPTAFPSSSIVNVEGVVTNTPFHLKVGITDGAGAASSVDCAITIAPVSPAKEDANKPPAADLDGAALEYWNQHRTQALNDLRYFGESQDLPSTTTFLVHLPSGAPAFAFPASVRENTPLQVVVIVPKGSTDPIALSLTSCADIETFRIKPYDESGPQSAPDREFIVVPVGAWFKCGSGKATYSLTFGAEGTARTSTTSLRIRAVYNFAATFVLGYDTAPVSSFGTSVQGGTTRIIDNENRIGISAYVGAVWMVGGVDYEDMHWYNYFVNPFIAINPLSPTKDALVGLAFTPSGGISVAVGMSLHERTVLNGVSVGDTFTGNGTVPTRDSWSDTKPGFFVGVAVDSNVYNAAKGLIAK